MLALWLQQTGADADVTMLHVLRNKFLWYLLGDMMLGAVVGIVFYRLLWPVLLRYVPRARLRWGALRLGLAGALAALLPLGLTVACGLATGAYAPATPGYVRYTPYMTGDLAPAAWKLWAFFGVQSTFEELLFRGVGLALLATLLAWLARVVLARGGPSLTVEHDRYSGRIWFACGLLANLVVSLAFGSVHQDNPHATVFAVCNIALAGFALGQLFWLQRSLWGACAMHTVWNAALALAGLPVSGILTRGPLIGNIHGSVDNAITGGDFGPEASAVTTAGLLLLSAWLVWQSWRFSRSAAPVDLTAEPLDLQTAAASGEAEA